MPQPYKPTGATRCRASAPLITNLLTTTQQIGCDNSIIPSMRQPTGAMQCQGTAQPF